MTDIFISYARDDDLPPPDKPDRKGFVTFLDESVRYEFRDLGPERPKIWRDTKRIADGAQFTPEIEQALKNASFLLVILSPNWMASTWCNRELETFAKYHGPDRLPNASSSSASIMSIPTSDLRCCRAKPALHFTSGMRIPTISTAISNFSTAARPATNDTGRNSRRWRLILLKRKPDAAPLPLPAYRPDDLCGQARLRHARGYDRIVSELVGKGHTVVPPPKEEIPLDTAVDAIDAALSNAEISVHLLGEKAGDAPEDQLPMVKLQLARAAAKEAQGRGRKVSPRHVGAQPLDRPSQAQLCRRPRPTRHPVDVLAKFDSQLPTDKVEGDSLSKFVDFLNQHLLAIAPPRPPSNPARRRRRCAPLSLSLPGRQRLRAQPRPGAAAAQLEALLPVFDGPDAEIKSFNGKQLAECDAVILCWASASEVWVRAQASGLRNWHDLGRTQQFFYRAVVAAPPPGHRKKAGKLLFPRSDIDLVVDLSDKDLPTADLLDVLVPARTRASAMNVSLPFSAVSAEHPFPGLRPFAYQDHEYFFGREDQTYALYRLIDRSHFIAVVGSSGSGKSSLVRAGLLPLLDIETREAGGHNWLWREMRPGDAPLQRLTALLASLSNDDDPIVASGRSERIAAQLQRSSFGISEALAETKGLAGKSIVLVIDQFEELFRYATTVSARSARPARKCVRATRRRSSSSSCWKQAARHRSGST